MNLPEDIENIVTACTNGNVTEEFFNDGRELEPSSVTSYLEDDTASEGRELEPSSVTSYLEDDTASEKSDCSDSQNVRHENANEIEICGNTLNDLYGENSSAICVEENTIIECDNNDVPENENEEEKNQGNLIENIASKLAEKTNDFKVFCQLCQCQVNVDEAHDCSFKDGGSYEEDLESFDVTLLELEDSGIMHPSSLLTQDSLLTEKQFVATKRKSKKPVHKGNLLLGHISDGTVSADANVARPKLSKGSTPLHICDYCGVHCRSPSRLIEHRRTHTGERPLECIICHARFPYTSSLRSHYKMHEKDTDMKSRFAKADQNTINAFDGSVNAEEYATPNVDDSVERNIFMRTCHGNGHPRYTCFECGKASPTPSKLKEHMRSHTGEKPYRCGICGSSFPYRSSIASHMNTHRKRGEIQLISDDTQDMPKPTNLDYEGLKYNPNRHVCKLCGKGFPTPSKLKEHQRRHTGERPYICLIEGCNATFPYRSSITAHAQMHIRDGQVRGLFLNKDIPACSTDACGLWQLKPYEPEVSINDLIKETVLPDSEYFCAAESDLKNKTNNDVLAKYVGADNEEKADFCDRPQCNALNIAAEVKDGYSEDSKECEPTLVECRNDDDITLTEDTEDSTHSTVLAETSGLFQTNKQDDSATREISDYCLTKDEDESELVDGNFLTNEADSSVVGCFETKLETLSVNGDGDFGFKIEPFRSNLKYECSICHKRFATPSKLKYHFRCHSGERPYKCHLCDRSFPYPGSLRCHVKLHKERETGLQFRKYKCDECGKAFMTPSKLRDHHRSHTGDRPFECNVCHRCFPYTSSLKQHMLTHADTKPYVCSECGEDFSHPSNLRAHQARHSKTYEFSCQFCQQSFANKTHLQQHENIHTGVKSFKCNVCAKAFMQASSLAQHKKLHLGERPHTCHECGQGFSHSANLKQHLRTHTGEKPYCCSVCNKMFAQQSNLKQHELTHTGARPHSCTVCQKAFRNSSNLKQHMKIHTGEKNYLCPICEKRFAHAGNMKQHVVSQHAGHLAMR